MHDKHMECILKKIRTLATIPHLTQSSYKKKNKPYTLSKGKDSLQVPLAALS